MGCGTVSALYRTVYDFQAGSRMLCRISCRICILNEVKTGLRCIGSISVITMDGMSPKVNGYLLPGIRNLNGMVNVL